MFVIKTRFIDLLRFLNCTQTRNVKQLCTDCYEFLKLPCKFSISFGEDITKRYIIATQSQIKLK